MWENSWGLEEGNPVSLQADDVKEKMGDRGIINKEANEKEWYG